MGVGGAISIVRVPWTCWCAWCVGCRAACNRRCAGAVMAAAVGPPRTPARSPFEQSVLQRQWQRMHGAAPDAVLDPAAVAELRRVVAKEVGVSEAAVAALEKAHHTTTSSQFSRSETVFLERLPSGTDGGQAWRDVVDAAAGLDFGFPSVEQVRVCGCFPRALRACGCVRVGLGRVCVCRVRGGGRPKPDTE